MICDKRVFSQVFSTLNSNDQKLFTVQARTLSQIFLSTGILSPVSIDSSIVELPEIIIPSTGIFSHDFTKTMFQVFISSIFVSINS
jgi:hypothetical protein